MRTHGNTRPLRCISLALALTLSVTTVVAATATTPIPLERILATALLAEPSPRVAKVVLRRPKRHISANYFAPAVTVDGITTFKMKAGEHVEFYVTPDDHYLGVIANDGMREIGLEFKAGKTYYFRLIIEPGNGWVIERSSQSSEKQF